MDKTENLLPSVDDTIVINGPSSVYIWCHRFSISPFTLFHLLKTVGNSAREIEELLHKHQYQKREKAGEPVKSVSIL